MKQGPAGGFGAFKRGFAPPGTRKKGGGVSLHTSFQPEKEGGRITVGRAMEAHLASLKSRNYSHHTIRGADHAMRGLLRLTMLSNDTRLTEITSEVAQRAMLTLARSYNASTAWRYATGWARLFRSFTAAGWLLENPFGRIEWPRRPRSLPGPTLSEEDVKKLLRAPNLGLPSGVRDRAVLEVFYSAALRLSELAHLEVRDLDFARRTVTVRRGKGGKARVVPLGETAIAWLRRYLKEVRPRFSGKSEALWIGQTGKPVTAYWIQVKVRRLGQKAKIGKPVTPHTLRRTCATHLLASGASAWAVRDILGHADFRTLGRYISLGAKELREIHEKTHPRA